MAIVSVKPKLELEKRTVTVKVDELNVLAWELRRTDTKRSLVLAEEALRLARTESYDRGQAHSLLALGYGAMRSSDLQAAQAKVQRAAEFFGTLDDQEGSRQALNTLGIIYGQSGNYVGALKTFLTLQRLCTGLGESRALADTLNNVGIAYFNLGDHTNALDYYFKALDILRGDEYVQGEVGTLINIGMVYFERGRFEEALDAFLQAQGDDVEDDYTHALLRNHLGRTYFRLGQFEQALIHNQESLTRMTALDDHLGASYAQDDLAAIYAKLGQVEQAEGYLAQSLATKRAASDTKGEAEVCLQLGDLYLRTGQLELALDTLHEGLTNAQKSAASDEVRKAHRTLAAAYKKNRQFREACLHLEKHDELTQEAFNRESDLRLQALRVQHEVEQTERENELYRLKNVELADAVASLRELTTSLRRANDEKATLLSQLEKQSREDALTGLYNRRYLDETLEKTFAHAKRHEHALSVVVCDIDHFKRVNDDFSHQMGDVVLTEVARLLKAGVRQGDTVARYGGEEFVIILPETSSQNAAHIVERIRQTIQNYPWHTFHPELKITMSAGLSDDLSSENHEKLVGIADKKLYEAKRGGRNRLVV